MLKYEHQVTKFARFREGIAMKKPTTGTYEYTRDSDRLPICWDYPNNHCLPHFHSSLDIIYVRGGEMKATLNGKTTPVLPGQIVLVPTYAVHHFATEIESDTLLLIVPLDYIPAFKSLLLKKTFAQTVVTDDQQSSELLHILEILASGRYAPDSPIYRGYVQVAVGLCLEMGQLVDAETDQNSVLVRDILTYLQEHFLEELDLSHLASHFGYSKSRFSHIFNENFQTSLTAYLNSLRCRHAANLLLEGKPQIDVALQSGFDNIRTFYRAFRQYYQETPTQYCNRMGA